MDNWTTVIEGLRAGNASAAIDALESILLYGQEDGGHDAIPDLEKLSPVLAATEYGQCIQDRIDQHNANVEAWATGGDTMTIKTIKQLASVYDCDVATNDHGNGCGGPGYIPYGDACEDATPVTQVTRDSDPEAWQLAESAKAALGAGCSDPTVVCVGDEQWDGEHRPSNPYQRIYFV